MNLKHVQLEKQDDEAFHLKDKTGSFKVLKKHVSKNLLDAIHQHFAEGGEVQKVQHLSDGSPEGVQPQYGIPSGFAAPTGPAAPDPLADLRASSAKLQGIPSDASFSVSPVGEPGTLRKYIDTHKPSVPVPGAELTQAQYDALPLERDLPPMAQPPQAQPSRPAVAPKSFQPTAPSPGGGVPTGFDKQAGGIEKEEEAAIRANAKVAGDRANFDLLANQKLEKDTADADAYFAPRMQQITASQDALQKDIANSTIKPENWWHSRSTGQKVTSVVALILGGIGQGLGGGPNPALKIMDDAVEKDIEAQKANLGKKQTQLGDLMKQGYSLQEAHKLARANARAVLEAQLARGAATFGTAQANANAMKAIAESKDARLRETHAVHQQGFQNYIESKKLELEKAKAGIGKPLMEQDVGKLAAQKDAPEVIEHIRSLQHDVGLSGAAGAVTPEWLHFGAQRQLDNAVNAASGPLSVAAFPLARTESPELTKMVKEQMPTGLQSSAAADTRLDEMLNNIKRASATKLQALAAGNANPAEIAALRIQSRVPVVSPTGQYGTMDESELARHPDYRRVGR